MDLSLDIALQGPRGQSVQAEVVRELTAADLALLELSRGIEPKPIQKLRAAHHSLAAILATGVSGAEASAATGYSQSRISILKSDPAFQELMEFYHSTKSEVVADLQTVMAQNALLAAEVLRDRLEERPDEVATDDVLKILEKTADRTGHAPVTKSLNVNATVNLADRLAAGRARAAKVVNAVAPALAPPSPEEDS